MYNFDKRINRYNTNSVKFDLLKKRFGKEDLLSMWVADMDFEIAPHIKKTIKEKADFGVFGYTYRGNEFFSKVKWWMERRHGWEIKTSSITYSPGVVPSLNFAVLAFTKPGDGIIVQPPVYYPFFMAVEDHKRVKYENPLVLTDGIYEIDFVGLEELAKKPETKLMFFCNPHNPGGRVWTEEEVLKVCEICAKNGVILVSDEIHADIVFSGKHIPAGKIAAKYRDNIVTLNSPTKTFNIAALDVSYAIIEDKEKKDAFDKIINGQHIGMGNVFGNIALESAYTEEGESWMNSMLEYVSSNIEYFYKELNGFNDIKILKPEATYLVWIDFRETRLPNDKLKEIIIEKAKLALNDGEMFGTGGKGFQRINLATPRYNVEESVNRIKMIFH